MKVASRSKWDGEPDSRDSQTRHTSAPQTVSRKNEILQYEINCRKSFLRIKTNMSRTILMMFSFSSVWFCYFLLLYQVSMNIYCTKFWTKIWITRWELKIFVSLRWEPKPHFIGACLVPPSSNRLNGAGVFVVYSGQMHTVTSPVGYFPINMIFSRCGCELERRGRRRE